MKYTWSPTFFLCTFCTIERKDIIHAFPDVSEFISRDRMFVCLYCISFQPKLHGFESHPASLIHKQLASWSTQQLGLELSSFLCLVSLSLSVSPHARTIWYGIMMLFIPQKDRGPLIEPLPNLCQFYVLTMDRYKTVPQCMATSYYKERER